MLHIGLSLTRPFILEEARKIECTEKGGELCAHTCAGARKSVYVGRDSNEEGHSRTHAKRGTEREIVGELKREGERKREKGKLLISGAPAAAQLAP